MTRRHRLSGLVLIFFIAAAIVYGVIRFTFTERAETEQLKVMDLTRQGELARAEDLSVQLTHKLSNRSYLLISNLASQVTDYREQVIDPLISLQAYYQRLNRVRGKVDFSAIESLASEAERLLQARRIDLDVKAIEERVLSLENKIDELDSYANEVSKLSFSRQSVEEPYSRFEDKLDELQKKLTDNANRLRRVLTRRILVSVQLEVDLEELEQSANATDQALASGDTDIGPWTMEIERLENLLVRLNTLTRELQQRSDSFESIRTEISELIQRLNHHVAEMKSFEKRKANLKTNYDYLKKITASSQGSDSRLASLRRLRKVLSEDETSDSRAIWYRARQTFERELKPDKIDHFDRVKAKEIREHPASHLPFEERYYLSDMGQALKMAIDAEGERNIEKIDSLEYSVMNIYLDDYPSSLSSLHWATRKCLREYFSYLRKCAKSRFLCNLGGLINLNTMLTDNAACYDFEDEMENLEQMAVDSARQELLNDLSSYTVSPFRTIESQN